MSTSQFYQVYIVKCSDDSYYTGYTADLESRMERHQSGKVLYTSTRLPVELVFFCGFIDKYKALRFEKYLKSGSGKAFAQRRFM